MTINLGGYYDRSESEELKGYERHLFRAGLVLQSAEMNEIQAGANRRISALGDAIYRDGDIVRDARAIVNQDTGVTQIESGAIYLRGTVRGVPSGSMTIPTSGTVVIGIYLNEVIVTEATDSTLLDPARETRAYNEPGAARLQVLPQWGYLDDGTSTGEFFPIYYVDDGLLRAKEPPPQLDSVSQAIARYDRDSTGTSYIVSGMQVSALPSLPAGEQIYSIKDGRARVNGFGVSLNTSRRITYAATPDTRYIDSEPHASTGAGGIRITLDRPPLDQDKSYQVRITSEKTSSLVHGTISGAQDPLPDTSIIEIVAVNQGGTWNGTRFVGGTTYVKDTDYKLTAGKVDWSLPGNEPAPGSTYTAVYRYITSVTPTDVDDNGFTVTGAVTGTLILVSYHTKLPRIDRLCMDETGTFLWVKGVATDYEPVRPQVQPNLLPICQVIQTWTSSRRVVNDGVRIVPVNEIEGINRRIDVLTDLVAQQKLISDVGVRESAAKKGLFVDPFLNDEQRDQGIPQTAAVVGFALTLPIDGDAYPVSADVAAATSCSFTLEQVLSQTSRTGDMKINPYMAFAMPPKPVTITPAVDRWTETQTQWLSPITRRFVTGSGIMSSGSTTSTTVQVSTSTSTIENLRQIDVAFQATGFGPGEQLLEIKFDGIAVNATAV